MYKTLDYTIYDNQSNKNDIENEVYNRMRSLITDGLFCHIFRNSIAKKEGKTNVYGMEYTLAYSETAYYETDKIVWIPAFINDKWKPRPFYLQCKSDCSYYVLSTYPEYAYQCNVGTLKGFNYEKTKVFDTQNDCEIYIDNYWYHGLCGSCKYDKYSYEHRCSNCKNKVLVEGRGLTDDKLYYCNKIYSETNIQFTVARNALVGELICRNYSPIVNNGAWIDFDWYLEVMKNCWYNVNDFCPAQDTICRTQNFDIAMKHKFVTVSLGGYNHNNRAIKSIKIPYLRWLMFDFIKNGDIYCAYVEYEKTSSNKLDTTNTVELNDYITLRENHKLFTNDWLLFVNRRGWEYYFKILSIEDDVLTISKMKKVKPTSKDIVHIISDINTRKAQPYLVTNGKKYLCQIQKE